MLVVDKVSTNSKQTVDTQTDRQTDRQQWLCVCVCVCAQSDRWTRDQLYRQRTQYSTSDIWQWQTTMSTTTKTWWFGRMKHWAA